MNSSDDESDSFVRSIPKVKPKRKLHRGKNDHGLRIRHHRQKVIVGQKLHKNCVNVKKRVQKVKQPRHVQAMNLFHHQGYSLRPLPHRQNVKKNPKKKIPKRKSWKKSDFCNMDKSIGEGTFGKIYFVNCKEFNQKFAVKMLKHVTSQTTTPEEAIVEAKIQRKATHVNIVKCFGVFMHDGYFWLVLELCPMGDLDDFVYKRLHSSGKSDGAIGKKVKSFVRQIVSGIEYVQNKLGYIHMDLKLDNVLIYNNLTVKVTDFGCAVWMESPRKKHYKDEYEGGVPSYNCPPELLKKRGYFFDSTADVWAIGCITYEMLTKSKPFFNSYKNAVQEKACIKNALRVIRNVHRGKFQNKFIDRLGPHTTVLTFLRHIFVPRTTRPLVKNLLELDWLN